MNRTIPGALAALTASAAAIASDGMPDTGNQFPAAGAYYEYFVYLTPGELPDVTYAEQSCSGALISPKVLMTAAHCTAFNYTEDIGIAGYYDQAWVTFDLREDLRNDGRAQRETSNLQLAPDVGAVILVNAITDIQPLPLRAVGELDAIPGIVGTPVVSVGYGYNWAKAYGSERTKGLGPQLDLGGGNEVKRVARLGPVKNLFANSFVPRQDVKKGDDTVCFGDSGSPLFLERDGVVEPVISGVLSGATNWCQGSKDPYYRIDQRAAQEFLQCVIANQDDVAAACRNCSAEADLGLCE